MASRSGCFCFSRLCIGLSFLLCACTAQAALVFGDSSTGGFGTRGPGDSPISTLTVSQNTSINQIGVLVDLNSDGDLKFVINDASSNSFVLITPAKAFTDDGDTFKVSDAFSPVTLLAGHQYYIGAIADVGGDWNYDPFPNVITQNGISNQKTNNNLSNFNSPVLAGAGTAQIPIELFNDAWSAGDFNLDHHVDAADLAPMMAALTDVSGFQAAHSSLSSSDLLSIEDVNGDGQFTNADLQKLLINLKNGGGSTSVPEPRSATLLAIAGLALWAVYHRRLGCTQRMMRWPS
jgi:hypothetical protein